MKTQVFRGYDPLGDDMRNILITKKIITGTPKELISFSIQQIHHERDSIHEIIRYDTDHGPCHVHKFYEGIFIKENLPIQPITWDLYDRLKKDVRENWVWRKDRFIEKYIWKQQD